VRHIQHFCAGQTLVIGFYITLLVLAALTGLSFTLLACGLMALLLVWAAWDEHRPSNRPSRIAKTSTRKKKKKRGVLAVWDEDAVYRCKGAGWQTTRYVDLDDGVYELRYWLPDTTPTSIWLINLHSQDYHEIVAPATGQGRTRIEITASRYQFRVRPRGWRSPRWRLEFEWIAYGS
jgi:hypothetical protein